MIVSGEPVCSEVKDTPLFDAFVDSGPLEGALAFAFAARVVAAGNPPRRVRDLQIDYPQHEAFFQLSRNMVKARTPYLPAPLKCVECVAASGFGRRLLQRGWPPPADRG